MEELPTFLAKAMVLSELLVMLPFPLLLTLDLRGAGAPNVCQPEWGYGPSALHWGLISLPVMVAKQMPEYEQWLFIQRPWGRNFSQFVYSS